MSKRRGRKAKRSRVSRENGKGYAETTRAARRTCKCVTQVEYLECEFRFGCPGPDLVVNDLKGHRTNMTTREDLPVTPLAVLYGRGVLDRALYDAGLYYQGVLTLWRRGAGLTEGSVAAVYDRLLANPDGMGRAGDSEGPTVADRAKAEAAAIEAGMTQRQIGLARSVVAGDWHGAIQRLVTGHISYRPNDDGRLVPSGEIGPGHHRALLDIRGAFAIAAEHRPRLKSATLAA